MAELYGRQWALSIGDRQWTDLRVVFEVKRFLSKHPDPAQITIYNLAAGTRSSFDAGDQVRLTAGYRDNAALLYSGTVTTPTTQRDGPDWATSLGCRDGDDAFRATVRQVFAKSAPLSLVCDRLASAMGLRLGAGAAAVLAGKSTRGGVALIGQAQDALERTLAPHGLRYILQDGDLIILPADGHTTEAAILLSPDTGLVGSPEPLTKAAKFGGKNASRLRVTSLLQPAMRPGRLVQLDSVQHKGTYRCDNVTHKGDSHGTDWYSIAEVRAV